MRSEDAEPEPKSGSPSRAPAGLVALARVVVSWERLWPALWPAAGMAGAFAGLALLDVLPLLPEWAHGIFLVGAVALLAWLVRRAFAAAARAGAAAGRARIERDSGLVHRPLTAIDDRMATGADDAASRALWEAHLAQAAEAAARGLKLNLPAPGLAARDPWAFRAAALLLLAIGLMAGHGDPGRRLVRALNPGIAATDAAALALEVWITPPPYTRQAPIFLSRAPVGAQHEERAGIRPRASAPAAGTPAIPVGSAVLVQATGEVRGLTLSLGGARTRFVEIAKPGAAAGARTASQAEATLDRGDAIVVAKGGVELHRWPIRILADAPPAVAFLAAPSAASGARLRLDFEATDDYGVVGVQAIIRKPESQATDGEAEIRVPLQTGSAAGPVVKGTSLHDLSAHPMAGTNVTIQLEATDARGQTGTSEAIPARLPERFFNHPVARALAELRKRLADSSPQVIEDVVMELERISQRPQHFGHDTVAYLALRIAIGRLAHDGGAEAVTATRKILWDTALRIEDGKFAVSGRDLRDLQERLARALRDGQGLTPEAERLLDEIKRALDKLFAALAEDMAREGAEPVPFDPETMQMVDSADLYRMIEEARELMRMGAMDAAKQMLSELQRMLQGLQRGLAATPQAREAQKGTKMMNDLREMSRRQQQLLDRSFRRMREGDNAGRGDKSGKSGGKGKSGEGSAGDDARAQNALRRMLGEMMRQMDAMLGKIPDSLGSAERAMRRAEGALEGGDSPGAVGPQTEAVEALRDAVQGIGEQLARRLGGPGMIGEMPQGERGPTRDPFGREPQGAQGTAAGGDVRVPDRGERLRAREILDELRRRAGERERPFLERDYIDRLLKMY